VATRFAPLVLKQPDLFGVRLTGSIGRTEKKWLEQLAVRCLKSDKIRIIFDLAELESIGGVGAAVLAELQRKLIEAGGGMVFVGAGSVVKRFLLQKFTDLPLRLFASLDEAQERFHDPSAALVEELDEPVDDVPIEWAESEDPDDEAGGAVCFAWEEEENADSVLDELLGVFSSSAEEEANGKPAAESSVSSEAPVAAETPGCSDSPESGAAPAAGESPDPSEESEPGESPDPTGATVHHEFLSLEDALGTIRRAADAAALEQPLDNLLYSYDLAAEVVYCVRKGRKLKASDRSFAFPADGTLARLVGDADRPLSLLDIAEDELDETEARVLAEVQPDLILPIKSGDELQAVAFLRRGKEEHEYGVSEHFALEMLMRMLQEFGSERTAPAKKAAKANERAGRKPAPDVDAEFRLQQAQALLRLNSELHDVASERQFWQRIFKALTPTFGVETLLFLEFKTDMLGQTVCLGASGTAAPLEELADSRAREFFASHEPPLPVAELPASLKLLRAALQKHGFQWLAPLRAQHCLSGYVLLRFRSDPGPEILHREYLTGLFRQAAAAWGMLRANHKDSDWNLSVVQKLVCLVEERHYGSSQLTDRMIPLIERLARDVGFPPDQERDLIYGALLRDIGMVPLGDLVLHAPQKLSKDQWAHFRAHPEAGLHMLDSLAVSQTVRDVVHCHHERFNGEGYPRGLKGTDIPLAARICALVENYVAMITDLPNRPALPMEQAFNILSENWGERYDPELVTAFKTTLRRQRKTEAEQKASPEAVPVGR
jgi:anti-anti-sigma regulatory factor